MHRRSVDIRVHALKLARSQSTGREPMNAVTPLLLDVKTAAQRIGVSRATLDRWIARGDLRPVAIRGRRRLSRAEIDRFVERVETEGGGGNDAQLKSRVDR